MDVDVSRDKQPAVAHPKKNGFSLIEALVALLIMLFMLAAVAYLMNSTIQTNRQTRRLTAAINLAQDQMERLRGMAYVALIPGTYQDGPLSESGDITGPGLIYRRNWRVTDNAGPPTPPQGAPPAGTKTLGVGVDWSEKGDPNDRSVRLQTIVAQP